MVFEITNGVMVSVDVIYNPKLSSAQNNEFFFTYKVTIENQSDEKIKLLSRHWHIFDAIKGYYEVEGEGVVGFQPTLLPDENHSYESTCILSSEIGKMYGSYNFMRFSDGKMFEVKIPEFKLEAPQILN